MLFIFFAIGVLYVDFVGALSAENSLSIRIAEIGPFVFGMGLIVVSLHRKPE